NAEIDWNTAVAQLASAKATAANTRLQQESNLIDARSALELAESDLELNQELAKDGLVSSFFVRQKEAAADQARNRVALLEKQLEATIANEQIQIAPAEAA